MNERELEFWTKAALKDRENALPSLRDTASKWAGTITALTALLATAGITLKPDLLKGRKADPWGVDLAYLVPSLLLILLVALITSVYLANRAAHGWPGVVPYAADAYREHSGRVTRNIQRLLNWSWLAAFIALGTGLLLAALVFFSQAVEPAVEPAPYVRVITEAGVFCGTVDESDDGNLRLTTQKNKVVVLGLAPTSDLTPVKDCYAFTLPGAKE
ncbi:hypothetical protein SAMN04488058_101304 [Deinococcus reticulitermitis]|uniref:Uncharacterized protein n=1 Tax=Deinococcus reticulitermitis TaxID=856736 RepID=A0A1H6SH16_9DEIO|nr:hypothetical protein [Deinococcus reticulitermitis]SEI67268.1 hypothetical protein SAMN04488058_101304 [Deinococcus reticulitermitis]